jgi:hypothetical protein
MKTTFLPATLSETEDQLSLNNKKTLYQTNPELSQCIKSIRITSLTLIITIIINNKKQCQAQQRRKVERGLLPQQGRNQNSFN